jgi:RHS repeat-associated protein
MISFQKGKGKLMNKQFNQLLSWIVIVSYLFMTNTIAFGLDKITFYHTDQVGTPLAMTNHNGEKIWEAEYMPFGEEYTVSGIVDNNKRFVGKEKDEETGLSYFGARYMDVEIGRFLAPDPVRAVNAGTGGINTALLGNPQRLNPYTYSLNNPYKYVDPDGRDAIVLLDINAAGDFGHLGIAIGNDVTGWTYYSQDGPGNGGGHRFENLATKKDVKQKFMTKNLMQKDLYKKYEKYLQITTTSLQDEQMVEYAEKNLHNPYEANPFKEDRYHCSDLVTNTLKAADVSTGINLLGNRPKGRFDELTRIHKLI